MFSLWQVIVGLVLGPLQNSKRILEHCIGFSLCNDPLAFELLSIELSHSWMCTDGLVHLWLGEGRLVTFVVSPSTVADKINEDIFMTFLMVGIGQSYRGKSGFRIVGINMDNRDFKA